MNDNKMKQIYIRVDGNEIIATGHVMRCLSIAEQIRKAGAEVIFIVADDRPKALIEGRGFSVDVLDTIWNDLNEEIGRLCDYVKECNVKVLLLDSYFVTKEYLQNLSQYTKIVYIDDLNRFVYPVHTVINYGAFAKPALYDESYRLAGLDTKFLIGSRYVPLREEFTLKPFKVQEVLEKVLITTGGTDQLNVAGDLLSRLVKNRELAELEYHVIVGCFNQNREKLHLLADKNPNIYLHENVDNMSDWMRSCDAAISAAGTTIYELCACGIPTICLEIADNQEGAAIWEDTGYMLYAGNAYRDREQCMQGCLEALLKYKDSYEERKDKSMRMQSLIDGYGAVRIAKYLLDGGLENAE